MTDTASIDPASNADLPLAGIRVVDLGHWIAGPLAAMLLADQGADVIHVDSPHSTDHAGSLDAVLNRNKRRVAVDLKSAQGAAYVRELLRDADVLIHNFRPGVMERLGLGTQACVSLNPRLVLVSIPGFASTDRVHRDIAAWEGIVGAATGLFTNVSFSREFLGLPPVFTALPLPSVYAAVHAAAAATMALLARERDGMGDVIEVPLASAMASAMGANVLSYDEQPERYDIPPVARAFRDGPAQALRAKFGALADEGVQPALELAAGLAPPFMCDYECADGRKLYVFAMDHRRMAKVLLQELGVFEELRAQFSEQDPYALEGAPDNLLDVGTLGKDQKAILKARIATAFLVRSAAEWEERLNAAGVPCTVHRSTQEWLDERHATEAMLAVRVADPILGATAQPGPAVWVDSAKAGQWRAKARQPASPGGLITWHPRSVPPAQAPSQRCDSCLAGLRVLDLSSMIAGPSCARTLAEYGAEVIKVDAVHPLLGPRMTIWYSPELNQGKRSILVDLSKREGTEVLAKLIEDADVLVHNMRPGVMARLGFGQAQIERLNPHLVTTAISAYDGPMPGPWSARPGYDPVVQAATGITVRYGSPTAPELHAIASTIDYLTGFLAAFGAALGLLKAARVGGGGSVRTSLAQASMLAQLPFSFNHDGKVSDEPSGQLAKGWAPTDRLYKTRDSWIYVYLNETSLGRLGQDPRFMRCMVGPTLGEEFSATLGGMSAADAVSAIMQAGGSAIEVSNLARMRATYPCPRDGFDIRDLASSFGVLLDDAHPCGTGVATIAPGYARPSRRPLRIGARSEKHGASTRAVLHQAGFGRDIVDDLFARGVLAGQLCETFLPS